MIALPAALAFAALARAELVPTPQTVYTRTGSGLDLSRGCRIVEDIFFDHRPRRFLAAQLAARGIAVGDHGPRIVLHHSTDLYEGPLAPGWVPPYNLTISGDEALLAAVDPPTLFSAVQTLLQWIDDHPGGVPPVFIQDRPDLKYRGITVDFRYASMTREQIRRAIDRVAALKGNLMVWWLQDRFAWKSHPELAGPGALSATEWGELVAYANDRFIEMVPYVDAYGHGERYLENPRWLALSRSEHGYWGEDDLQYCASHPDSWKLFDDLTREAVAVFTNTKFVHIGMDEVGGQDDHLCAECRAAVRTLAAATGEAAPFPRARNAFIAKRLTAATTRLALLGRTPMFWDDSAVGIETLALGPGGIETVRHGLPFVWHYDADPARLRAALTRQGASRFHTVVATSSNNPDNIEHDITATRDFLQVIGAVATIWEGDVRSFDRHWPGFTQALALAWNRGATREARAAAEVLVHRGWAPLAEPEEWAGGNEESPAPTRTPDAPRAVRFACPFPGLKDWRLVWDGASRMDLAGSPTVRLRIRAAEPGALASAVVYFQSDGGWYRMPDLHPAAAWTACAWSRTAAATEGTPAGWNRVTGVRLSLLPAGPARRPTTVDLEVPAE